MKNIKINLINKELFDSFKALFPLDIIEENGCCKIELAHEYREIWGFPLLAGSEYIDNAIHSLEEHRKVIPAALYRCAQDINGVFLVGYYIKRVKNEEYNQGLVIIPANRASKEANSELLTSYCFEREPLYNSIISEDYFAQIKLFLKSYSAICKKYWIQDTKLINTSFVERPVFDPEQKEQSCAATSTWNTEIYPDFMRPISMIGDIYFDFMLCNHKLVSLQREVEDDDNIYDLFEEEGINEFYSMPSDFIENNYKSHINGWCETLGYELSSRKDLEFKTLYDIAVPGLKGSIIDQGYSIGWCGKVAFLGVGLDKPLYISPTLLKEITDVGDFEQTGNDNKAYWRNRDIDYRKNFATHNLVKVGDDLMLIKECKKKLIDSTKIALQSCKNPMKEVQKGINKYVIRYLKGLSRCPDEKKAFEFLEAINSVKICADEQEILYNIIDWGKKIRN